jgi:REP element-mobilizing transposase RayT
MKYNPDIRHRRSIRLQEYDYTGPGAYFITVCTQNGECLLSDVVKGKMVLNQFGEVVKKEWLKTFDMRRDLILDEYIVMPNHFHGIIIIANNNTKTIDNFGRGTLQRAPTFEQFGRPVSNSIPTVIRLFKSSTTKQINEFCQTPKMPLWQRNYYEHIIRNEDELNQIREYVAENPLKWETDEENPIYQIT